MANPIQFLRGLIANLPTLAAGQPGWTTDAEQFFVGTGSRNVLVNPRQGFRNKIIGGDFSTNPWQRGTTITSPASGDYSADRFFAWHSGASVYDIKKTLDGPTAEQAGYYSPYCLHVDITTADTSIASDDLLVLAQKIEGHNAACFGFGLSGTRYVTISFWVKSTKTGIFCVGLSSVALARSYVSEFTVSTANTWEKKTITIQVDGTSGSGSYAYDHQTGLILTIALMCGTSYHGTKDTWGAGAVFATSNQVNGVDSTSNDFKLSMIQLEHGIVATPFEHRDIGSERQLCERYFWRGLPGRHFTQFTTAADQYASWPIKFPVTMRDTPTMDFDGETLHSFSEIWVNMPTVDGARLIAKSSAADAAAYVEFSSSGYIEADAEI
jgi:hypothetical protein